VAGQFQFQTCLGRREKALRSGWLFQPEKALLKAEGGIGFKANRFLFPLFSGSKKTFQKALFSDPNHIYFIARKVKWRYHPSINEREDDLHII
jgi:hypothetical protein